MSDRTRCWFGAVTGHTVPMARMAIAGMRATRLSDEDIGAEYFLDRHAEPDTGLVSDVCKAMATALRSLGEEYGDTIPILPEAIADGRQTPKPWIVEAVCWDRGYVRERLREYGKADTEENVDAVVEQLKPWTGPGSSTTIAESACEKACEAIDVAIEDAGLPDRNEE